jgi:hypothetical protein
LVPDNPGGGTVADQSVGNTSLSTILKIGKMVVHGFMQVIKYFRSTSREMGIDNILKRSMN